MSWKYYDGIGYGYDEHDARRREDDKRRDKVRQEERMLAQQRQQAQDKRDRERKAQKVQAEKAAKQKKALEDKRKQLHEAISDALENMQNEGKPTVSLGRGGGFQDGAGSAYRQQKIPHKMGERIGPPVGITRESMDAAQPPKIGSEGTISSKIKF